MGLRDGWAVGTTARYTVGVWVGNASGEGRPGLTGSTHGRAADVRAVQRPAREHDWFDDPTYALKHIDVCANDGYLATDDCETERAWMPRDSHFDALSPHNLRVHLDATQQLRVDGDCESPVRDDARELVRAAAGRGVLLPPRACRIPAAAAAARGLSGRAGRRPQLPGAALSRRQCPRADPARARRHSADARYSRPFHAVAMPGSTGISTADTLAKRTLFTSSRWTSTPGEHILTLVDDAG